MPTLSAPCLVTLISTMIHPLALSAIGLNVSTSVHADVRTISAWRCATLHLPLVWSTLAFFVHGRGMLAIRVRIKRGLPSSFGSCFLSEKFKQLRTSKDGPISEAISWFASLYAVVHLVCGILVLSSLMFISALEAIEVFALYATCAVTCKLILLLELENVRHDLKNS